MGIGQWPLPSAILPSELLQSSDEITYLQARSKSLIPAKSNPQREDGMVSGKLTDRGRAKKQQHLMLAQELQEHLDPSSQV